MLIYNLKVGDGKAVGRCRRWKRGGKPGFVGVASEMSVFTDRSFELMDWMRVK